MAFLPKSIRGGVAERKVGAALALGTNMAAGMAVFAFLGYFVGKKLGHTDGGILVGLFLGLFYGGYEVWKVVKVFQQNPGEEGGETEGGREEGNGR